jgi:hypothetical protein
MMVFSDKNISWDKYGECEGDDAVVRQKKLRAVNPLHRGAPCVGGTHQMRMCQRSEDPITDLDGAISVENDRTNGSSVGSIQPAKNIGKVKCISSEPDSEKSCFLIYFLIFVLIMTMCGCGVLISDDKTKKVGGSEYVTYTNSGDLRM